MRPFEPLLLRAWGQADTQGVGRMCPACRESVIKSDERGIPPTLEFGFWNSVLLWVLEVDGARELGNDCVPLKSTQTQGGH